MQQGGANPEQLELKEIVAEASRALARLDADRLEELALSCQALNRDLPPAKAEKRAVLAREVKEAAKDMEVLARVLEATRANLNVMNRLRELRAGRLEYGPQHAPRWVHAGSSHGDN
ncbi:MAG: hypothetical protein ABR956_03105 [Terracidiphilus sp.]|jgi:hypothetical protein